MIWKMKVDYVVDDILVAGTFSNSLTTIFGGCVSHILIPRYCDCCYKRSHKTFGEATVGLYVVTEQKA